MHFLPVTAVLLLSVIFSSMVLKQGPSSPVSSGEGIDIIHYLLTLDIDNPDRNFLKGHVDIQALVTAESVSELVFDLLPFTVDSIWFNEELVPGFRHDGRKLTIKLPHRMSRGSPLLLTVFYKGKPFSDSRWGGFYFRHGTAFNMGVGMASSPPVFGRAWFPCVDNFTDRASYEFFIQVEDEYTAVCNGTLVEIIDQPGPYRTFHWQLQESIPTYLASVAVSRYTHIESEIRGMERKIPVSLYIQPGDSLKAMRSFRNLDKMLETYENLLGAYRWTKVGIVSVPFTGGAMEHATSISLSQSTITGDLQFELLYAHELAHSWFGNLVTCASAGDMWLNEGWARYSEALYREYTGGEEAYRRYIRNNHYNVLKKTHLDDKSYLPVAGIPQKYTYGSTVYDKGADMVHTLRAYMGDRLFFRTVERYLDHFAFSSVSTEEMQAFFTNSSGLDLAAFFDNWIYSAGFPVFLLDSMRINTAPDGYLTRVYISQGTKGRVKLFPFDGLEVAFYDNYGNSALRKLEVTGEKGTGEFMLSFRPVVAWLDPAEKVSDAITDQIISISKPGRYLFPECQVVIDVQSVSDSVLCRPMLVWIPPAGFSTNKELTADRYWDISFTGHAGTKMKASLLADPYFSFGGKLLKDSKTDPVKETFILYYRKNTAGSWIQVPFGFYGSDENLTFVPQPFRPGQYVLAVKPGAL